MMSEIDEIAIVGVGCKFPGADNLQEYWRVLKNGENHVKEVPRDRWNIDAFYDPDRNVRGKMYVRKAGFLDSIEEWDHRFHGINDMEAELVDPQQRIVLDCVHMALEDGGITRNDINGTQTGVYIGSMTDDYKGQVMNDNTISSTYSVTGTHNSIISARVSYIYNLFGPSMTLDTACSSSLVAIDIASQALLTGQCSMAICGGVNILLDPQLFIALSKAGMLSPSGQCRTFTRDADGYARGEGCGIVLLKSLKNAVKYGNKIWGTIKTRTNQDGKMASPITAPSGLQQERLLQDIYEINKIDKSRVSVIEAHGTGTVIGDPTEIKALGSHLGKRASAPGKVYIGSVKTNIGHLEAAAGVAGLIKVLLMMKHNVIVPSLWYTEENENPKLKLSEHGFVVPTQCTPWVRSSTEKRLCCVNSFGFGGTNVHAIVEEFEQSAVIGQEMSALSSPCPLPFILTISALDKISLIENVQHFYERIQAQVYDMRSLSYTSICRRDNRLQRKAFYGKTQSDIMSACDAFLNLDEESTLPLKQKKIIFVFCGVGTAWNGMCKSLMKLEPFTQAVACIDKYLKPLAGWTISDKFVDNSDILVDPMVVHVAIFACQIGLTSLWKQFNILPDIVMGQSVGEVAAAYVAGYLDLQTAVKIIFYRSKFLAEVKYGRMVVIRNVEVGVVEQYCRSNGAVNIAVFSSPKSCTVSGASKDIERFKTDLSTELKKQAHIIDLDVNCAYHSQHVEQAADQLEKELAGIRNLKGHIPIISTVTGQIETNGLFGNSNYWGQNVRKPVLFCNAVKLLESDTHHNVFLEIGPNPVLRAHIGSILTESKNYTVMPSMQKDNETNTFSETICKLYEVGINPNYQWLFSRQCQLTDIPTYKFHKYRQLYQSPTAVKKNQGADCSHFDHMFIRQLPQKDDDAHFKMEINDESTSFVFQHVVTGSIILPGSAYADVGFEIGSNVLSLSKEETLVSLEFIRPVKIDKGAKTLLYVSTKKDNDEILFHAKRNQVTTCKGWVRPRTVKDLTSKVDIDALKLTISREGHKHMRMDEMYENLKSLGFQYGPYFRQMKDCISNGVESFTKIEVPADVLKEADKTTIHPCVLDVMTQSAINSTTEEILSKIKGENLSFLPVAVGDLRVLGKIEKTMYVFTKRINTTILETVLQVHYNILLTNSHGIVVADLQNFVIYGKRNGSAAPCELKYRLTWNQIKNFQQSTDTDLDAVFLTNSYMKYMEEEFAGFDNITVFQNKEKMANERYISSAFEKTIQSDGSRKTIKAVVLLVGEYELTTEISTAVAADIHALVKQNCMLLVELVKFMTNKAITCPLYVVTQNTQSTFSTDPENINLVGEELWGFVRSVNLEFIHSDITMIDTQPSFKETKETLLRFIVHSNCNIKQTKQEIIIFRNKVFGAQFTKVPRKEIIPTLREETKHSGRSLSQHKVLALRSKRVKSLVLTTVETEQVKYRKENVHIRIKSVCIHPSSVYPATISGIQLDQDIWEETQNNGHNLFGLEYTGLLISHQKYGKGSSIQKMPLAGNAELLCIHPKDITTDMVVPKSCTVSLKCIPFYQPGLVLYSMLAWRLKKHVPKRSSVLIYRSNGSSNYQKILEYVLQDERNVELADLSKVSRETDEWIDVLISLEKIDTSFIMLRRCKRIICLEGSVSEAVQVSVSRSPKQSINCYSAVDLLDKRYVSKCLPKVVAWLHKHYQENIPKTTSSGHSSRDFFENDTKFISPCRSIDILKDGQIVLPRKDPIDKLFSKRAVYVVTGGLTGLGWEIVRLLAEMGAGIIATLSRRQVTAERETDISIVEKTNACKIICLRADVTDIKSVRSAFGEINSQSQFPVRGVFHGAGVLMGRLLMNMEESELDFVLQPKVIGTLNMHIATKEMNLDYFVVPSSINSIIGSPGQCSYGAANSFLETFIEWRRKKGLAGQAINWGALCVGMASRPEFVENFVERGFNLLTILEIRSCLQEALMQNSTDIIYTNINWDICAKNFTSPQLERTRLQMAVMFEETVSHVMGLEKGETISFDVKALKNAGEKVQIAAVSKLVQIVLSKVLYNTSQINTASTLAELSFDSMSTLTFINVIHDMTGYRIAPSFMLDTSHTLGDIVSLIYDTFFKEQNPVCS